MVMFLGINSQKSQGERVMVAAAAASEWKRSGRTIAIVFVAAYAAAPSVWKNT